VVVWSLPLPKNSFWKTASEEGYSALYKGLAPNIGRGMAMNMGMMACSDQAKEMMIAITKVWWRCTCEFYSYHSWPPY